MPFRVIESFLVGLRGVAARYRTRVPRIVALSEPVPIL